ncbi:hypothetical protein G6F63_015315 [Rhizopus arrhizus]|nr:hypothetical protein G6F63_015315 [Rhizopus arrhizus]
MGVEQAADEAQCIAERQHVHGTQQVAGDRCHPADRRAIARQHAQPQRALAEGAAPQRLADDRVGPVDQEHQHQVEAGTERVQQRQRNRRQHQHGDAHAKIDQPGHRPRQRAGRRQLQQHALRRHHLAVGVEHRQPQAWGSRQILVGPSL